MPRLYAALPLILFLAGCQTLARPSDEGRPALFVDGRRFNSAILDLTPQPFSGCPPWDENGRPAGPSVLGFTPVHGRGHPGRCLIDISFHVRLTDLQMDGTGALRLRGTVAAAHTGRATYAEVGVVHEGVVVQRVLSRDDGRPFELVAKPGESAILMVRSPGGGAHTMMVDLNALTRLARRVERFDGVPSPPADGAR